jgi:hypothetical protein
VEFIQKVLTHKVCIGHRLTFDIQNRKNIKEHHIVTMSYATLKANQLMKKADSTVNSKLSFGKGKDKEGGVMYVEAAELYREDNDCMCVVKLCVTPLLNSLF